MPLNKLDLMKIHGALGYLRDIGEHGLADEEDDAGSLEFQCDAAKEQMVKIQKEIDALANMQKEIDSI